MEHLEDIVIKHGVVGARQAINFLQALRDALAGRASDSVNTTVKWDGAPAIIVGRDEDDKLFVATKSYFSKNSISYKTPADIRNADLNSNDITGTGNLDITGKAPSLCITSIFITAC